MQLVSLALLLLTTPSVFGQTDVNATWTRPNDKSLDGIDLNLYDCGADCQAYLNFGIEADREECGTVPFDEDFYATAKKFSPKTSKAGDLLKKEPYINATSTWSIPEGTTLYRIQYVSIGQDNALVPATAFVALPFARRHDKKPFRVVAFAHGTIGTFYACAPSATKDLYDYQTWQQTLLSGYAVVATDYAGLGNNYTQHRYLASTLAANDIYYSVVAAKKAFGGLLSKKWASTGHSQGGGAVWGLVESNLVTETAPCAKDMPLEFVGGVAISPGNRIADIVKYFSAGSDVATLCGYADFVYEALEATAPGSTKGLFTPTFVKRTVLAQKIGACFTAGGLLVADLCAAGGASAVFESALSDNKALTDFQKNFGAGLGKKAQAPMLIVQSKGDHTVPWNVTVASYDTTCKAGGVPLELSLYPTLDHSPTPGGSSYEWLEWLNERFEGKSRPHSCQTWSYEAVDAAAAYNPAG